METTRVVHLELWERLNVVGAAFCLWLGIVLALTAAAVSSTGLGDGPGVIPLRPIIMLSAFPGLLLGAYWLWKARELQAGSFFQTVTETEDGLVQMFRSRARTVAFYTAILGLIVLLSVALNYPSVRDLSGLFHLSALASLLFASYGASYLYLHVSVR